MLITVRGCIGDHASAFQGTELRGKVLCRLPERASKELEHMHTHTRAHTHTNTYTHTHRLTIPQVGANKAVPHNNNHSQRVQGMLGPLKMVSK